MLYVFLVDTGTMMTFNMNLALDDVAGLKRAIAREYGIPEDKQVLLVSGGASLDPSVKVCNYGSGTDTCPIFLFSKCSIDSETPPNPSTGSIPESNIEDRYRACLGMPATYNTVVVRVQIAKQFSEIATTELRLCERLVHDQRLQQQGWATVIANLQDTTYAFTQQAAYVEELFVQYLKSRPTYQALLENFSSAVGLLAKIPLLPCLLPEEETSEANTEVKQTLLDWLSTEPSSTLEHLAHQCMRWLDQFNEDTFRVLKIDIEKALVIVDDPSMKEVKGLEDRLYQLDKMMCDIRKYESDQIKQAENLHQHQVKIKDCNDMTILPDLCNAHLHQLGIMQSNHQHIRDVRDTCIRAKIELSNNLHTRLKWILCVEKMMFDANNKLAIHRENLKRLSQHLEAIQQVHLAPTSYLKAIVEVCRRRSFSSNFLKWASGLAEQSHELHQKEVTLRQAFNCQFSSNLISALFPGMEDLPPPFATECPQPFDVHLPKIIPEDLERLKALLPEMANIIELPIPDRMPQTCTTSDSAFSSEVPLSRIIAHSTSTSLGTQPFRTENQESLSIDDYASAANETASLASSPFEDPMLPASSMDVSAKHGKSPSRKKCDDSEVECKRLHLTDGIGEKETFSPIEEEQNNVESDAEEFERVDDVSKSEEQEQFEDPCAGDVNASSALKSPSNLEAVSREECVESGAAVPEPDSILPKAPSENEAPSPVEEGLRSPDSLITSQDFQQTDYFIDDSMPSSYTESNGSALLKGNQMVKSHHVIVAELQNQLEEKNAALASAQGKLKMSRSNILKLRRTITALQRHVQVAQEDLKRDLLLLKEYVTREKSIALGELAETMEEVRSVVSGIQTRIYSDKEDVVNEAVKRERENLEMILQKHQNKLEVEAQKLADCQSEIDMYQEQIRQYQLVVDDLKQDAECKLEEFKKELCEEKDNNFKRMMLEYELEMENVRDVTKRKVLEKEEEIHQLQEALAEKEAQIQLLLCEKERSQEEEEERLKKEKDLLTKSLEVVFQQRQETAIKWALDQQADLHQQEIKRMNEEKEKFRIDLHLQITQTLEEQYESNMQRFKLDLEEEFKECFAEEKLKFQQEKECEFQQLKDTLAAQYKEELDSMRSRFKYAYSTTSIERMPSDSSLENLHLEKDVVHISTHEKALSQLHEKLETEKAKSIAETIELETKKSQEAVLEAVSSERRKHEMEMMELTKKIKEEHEEQVEKIKIRHGAEKQVMFNEAIHRATREKDVQIEKLQSHIVVLETQFNAVKAQLDQIMQEVCNVSEELSSSSSDSVSDERTLTDRTTADKLSEAVHRVKEMRSQIDLPASPIHRVPSTSSGERYENRICELEQELAKKVDELEKMKMKCVKMSFSEDFQSYKLCDKVSVLTCNVGDLVLLCYEEKHENYVVFYFGPVPHFLHTESLELLELKIPPEEPRKAWALVEVLDKEYCQAKKVGNRYKVPHGSRFYRVKVKPWDRDAAVQRYNQRRLTSSISTDSPKPSTAGPSSSDDAPPKGGPMSSSTI